MFERKIYKERRRKLMEAVGSGLILLPGNNESSMNYKDNLYPFRQDSCFLYFFGLDQPALIAVLDIDSGAEMLYGDDPTVEEIVWTGRQEPLQDRASRAGVDIVKPVSAFAKYLSGALRKGQTIHYLPPYRSGMLLQLSRWLEKDPSELAALASEKLIKAIVAQRSYKSPEEIAEIEKAVNITGAMQLEAIRSAEEGMTEAAIAGRLQGIAISNGGNLSFPTILTVNGQTLHIGYSEQVIGAGKMILCDCGAETSMHYAGDLTRTFPVRRKFTAKQKDIYQIVFDAYTSAAAALRPGILFRDVHLLACEKLVEGLKQLGLMKGDTKEAVAAGAHALFFPCGLGHMMGLDTHDMENLGEQFVGYTDSLKKSKQFGLKSLRLGRALEEGFVLTVEPGLYFIPELIEEWGAENKYAEFIDYGKVATYKDFGGIRVEDDFVINADGARMLGNPISPTIAEMESARKQESL